MSGDITCAEIPSSFGDIFYHTSTLYKDYIITFGGKSMSTKKISADIQILNLKTNSAEKFTLEGDEPLIRYRHSACLINQNQILIFGGEKDLTILNNPAIITIQGILRRSPLFSPLNIPKALTLTYKNLKTTGGDDLVYYGHSANISQNKMYVFGGRRQHLPLSNNDLWSLDLGTFHWELCETTGEKPEPRLFHCSAVFNQKLYIFGGFCDQMNSTLDSCSVLSLETMQWERLQIKGRDFLPRFGTSSVVIEGTLYIMGGYYRTHYAKNELFTFHFEESKLDGLELQGDYTPVIGGSAVCYKNRIILCGGLKTASESTSKICCLQSSQNRFGNPYTGSNHSFASDINALFSSEEFADIHFSIEGQQISAHKLVLCLRCKYFAQLFKSGMKESHSSVIEISDVKLETFKGILYVRTNHSQYFTALLRFLYQNQVEFTETLALDLYVLADKYRQEELMKLCETFLRRNVRWENLETLIDLSEKFGVDSLKKSIMAFIMSHPPATKQIEEASPLLLNYLKEIASQSRPNTLKKLKT